MIRSRVSAREGVGGGGRIASVNTPVAAPARKSRVKHPGYRIGSPVCSRARAIKANRVAGRGGVLIGWHPSNLEYSHRPCPAAACWCRARVVYLRVRREEGQPRDEKAPALKPPTSSVGALSTRARARECDAHAIVAFSESPARIHETLVEAVECWKRENFFFFFLTSVNLDRSSIRFCERR